MRITSRFEAGSIRVLASDDPDDILLEIPTDRRAEYRQWFAFAVLGAEGVPLTMRLVNAGACTYAGGLERYAACASYDGERWFRVSTMLDGPVLTLHHVPRAPRVAYAYFAPYPRRRLGQLLRRVGQSGRAAVSPIARSVLGEALPHVLFRSKARAPLQVWVVAQQHPGETMAGWFAEGLLRRVSGGDLASEALLERAEVHVVPRMNPDGAFLGNHRTNAAGVDLNRVWWAPPSEAPEIDGVRRALHRTGVDLFLDVHGEEQVPYVFAAGVAGTARSTPRLEALERRFAEAMLAASPAFQIEHGYPPDPSLEGEPRDAADYVSETFDCLSLTLEMPFSDDANDPDPERGWSPERSMALGADTVDAIARILRDLR